MSFLERPLAVLKMGLRQHEVILAPFGKSVLPMMEKYGWACHRCGVRIPQYMQVDHTKGHGNPDPSALRPICVFCHDQEHLIWAAARKRVIPILARDLTNEDMSRIVWAVLALRGRQEDQSVAEALDNIETAFKRRHKAFEERYGSEDADSAIEAIYRFRIPQENETEQDIRRKSAVVERFCAETRFAPSLMFDEKVDDPAKTVAVWELGGFKHPARTPSEAIGLKVEPADLVAAVSSMMTER